MQLVFVCTLVCFLWYCWKNAPLVVLLTLSRRSSSNDLCKRRLGPVKRMRLRMRLRRTLADLPARPTPPFRLSSITSEQTYFTVVTSIPWRWSSYSGQEMYMLSPNDQKYSQRLARQRILAPRFWASVITYTLYTRELSC